MQGDAGRCDEAAPDIAERKRLSGDLGDQAAICNPAQALRLRAERKLGQMLRDMEKAKGAQAQLAGKDAEGIPVRRSQPETARTLSDLGISKTQSSRWQKLAAVTP